MNGDPTKAAAQDPKPVDVPFQGAQMVDLCPANRMAHILGCTNVQFVELVAEGRIPFMLVGSLRMYPVERVLRHVMSVHLPSPPKPLRGSWRKKCSYLDDVLWAWEALATGPWNVKTAKTSRAWALYLEAKRHVASRMLLSRMHILCAHRELGGGKRMADLERPTDESETTVLAEGSHEPEQGAVSEAPPPPPPPSIFGPIDEAKVANSPLGCFEPDPLAVGGETEY